uniref:MYND-type domain-containing protein n=1 Tax=Strigamia maritima TaxID=126957 RepID=T1J9Y5_STRMM
MAFKKGDLILKSEPYAYVLCSEFRGLYCDHCLKKHQELHKCTQCLFSFYCNKNCQKSAWLDHKQECLNLKRRRPARPTDFVRLIARIIYKLKTLTLPDKYEEIGNIKRGFEDLMSHVELIKNDPLRLNQYHVISKLIADFVTPDVLPSNQELFEIFGKITINSYSICDIEMVNIGVGLYLGASMFDHSCRPTATIVFEGPTLFLKAVVGISQLSTTKVFISYLDLLASTYERKRDLKAQYYFDCMCATCKDEEKDLITSSILCPNTNCSQPTVMKKDSFLCIECGEVKLEKTKQQEISELIENCKKVNEEMMQLQKLNKYQEIYDKADDSIQKAKSVLHIFNVHYVRVLDFAFDACINLSKWETACNLGKQILKSYRYHYGNSHPNYGIHLLKLGKILLYLEKLLEAEHILLEASTVIKITHTPTHQLHTICHELLSQCQMELQLK